MTLDTTFAIDGDWRDNRWKRRHAKRIAADRVNLQLGRGDRARVRKGHLHENEGVHAAIGSNYADAPRGTRRNRSAATTYRLTEQQRMDIVRAWVAGEKGAAIAKRFGV